VEPVKLPGKTAAFGKVAEFTREETAFSEHTFFAEDAFGTASTDEVDNEEAVITPTGSKVCVSATIALT
jgi:hypothetical protein